MEKSIWTGTAKRFFCNTWKSKKLCFFWGFLPFQSHLIPSSYWRSLAGGPRFISTFFSFHSTLSHGNLSTDSTVNTLYLKRGHKLLEVSARLNAEVRAELKITHFREPQVRLVQVNTKLPRKKANYTAVPEFILDKCLVFPSKWWYLRHTRNLTGKTGGISKLEYFVEAPKAQVVPIMNNQTLCLHFARRWASKMQHWTQLYQIEIRVKV